MTLLRWQEELFSRVQTLGLLTYARPHGFLQDQALLPSTPHVPVTQALASVHAGVGCSDQKTPTHPSRPRENMSCAAFPDRQSPWPGTSPRAALPAPPPAVPHTPHTSVHFSQQQFSSPIRKRRHEEAGPCRQAGKCRAGPQGRAGSLPALCLGVCLPGWCRGREGRNPVLPVPTQAARPCPCSGSISVPGVTVIWGLDAVATAVMAAISGTASDSAVTDRSGEEVFNTKND